MTEIRLQDLEQEFAAIPRHLAEQLQAPINEAALGLSVLGWDIVGVGASGGPARLLASVLQEAGVAARLVPISAFFSSTESSGTEPRSAERGLIVFSQGLSPNAQLALAHAPRYAQTVVFTAVTPETRPERAKLLTSDLTVIVHGPAQEMGGLLRLRGPLLASVAALVWAAGWCGARGRLPSWTESLSQLPSAYEKACDEALHIEGDISACLAVGSELWMAKTLMWKWQEALFVKPPPAIDMLAFAHGTLQAFYDQPAIFILLKNAMQPGTELLARQLRRVLVPQRHGLVFLRSWLPAPLSFFEYDAALSTMCLQEMRRKGITPGRWPGQGKDGPLYRISWPGKSPENDG